jgi:RNA recognition motif-containing protein
MADLWLGNLATDTSDDEIKNFLIKYGFPAYDGIEHIPGDGTRPAVRVTFANVSPGALRRLQPRVHDKFWKNRRLNAQVMPQHAD